MATFEACVSDFSSTNRGEVISNLVLSGSGCINFEGEYIGVDYFSGTWGELEYQEFMMEQGGARRVFGRVDGGGFGVNEDLVLRKEMEKLLEERKVEEEARRTEAVRMGEEDDVLAQIYEMHFNFMQANILSPTVKGGKTFFQVGRNSTHAFYLVRSEGRVWKLVEDGTSEEEEYTITDVTGSDYGYLGHL